MSNTTWRNKLGTFNTFLGCFVVTLRQWCQKTKPTCSEFSNICPEINTLIKEPLQFRRLKCLVSHTPLQWSVSLKKFIGGWRLGYQKLLSVYRSLSKEERQQEDHWTELNTARTPLEKQMLTVFQTVQMLRYMWQPTFPSKTVGITYFFNSLKRFVLSITTIMEDSTLNWFFLAPSRGGWRF